MWTKRLCRRPIIAGVESIELTLKSARLLGAFLAEPGGHRYGFELMRLTGLPSGTVYPLLARLETAGWLARTMEDIDPSAEQRPRRALYSLTAEALPVARARLTAIAREFGNHED